jgi:uncharacterized protein GlcG (DUF336 family)
MNIAVVDEGNNLTAFVRMDNAWLGSIDIAINKTYTTHAFDKMSESLVAAAQTGEPLFGINAGNRRKNNYLRRHSASKKQSHCRGNRSFSLYHKKYIY